MSLTRYLQLQEDQLQRLGREQLAQQQRRQLEQERFDQLKRFHETVSSHPTATAFGWRNRAAMREQVELYMGAQEQELQLSMLELQAKQQQVRAQFGRVKGLKQIQTRHASAAARREQRREQHRLDDWLSGTLRRD